MKKGNIFWGIVLVTIGVIFALRNFDIFFFNWHGIFRLWPLIFVFWGIAILPVKSVIKLILTVITIVLAIVILAKYPGSRYHWFEWRPDRYSYEYDYDDDRDEEEYEKYKEYPWEEQYIDEDYDSNTKSARLNIEAVAGRFYIKDTCSKLFEFKSEGDIGPYNVLTMQGDKMTTIDIEHKHRITRRGDFTNKVWLSLNPDPLWKFTVDVGAANLEMDLTPFKVEKIDIDGGAAKIEIKLGDRYNKSRVVIDAGASAIEILVPFESAVELQTSTILSSRKIEGFDKIKSGLYQTPNFSDSANQIFIEVDAAVSGLKVERY
jgi:hypothetical protein